MNTSRARERFIGACLFASALVVAALLLRPPAADETGLGPWAASAARVAYDDGFYYFQIARHVASGDGSTFDGLAPTNGYHPLWLLLLVPLTRVAGTPAATLVAAACAQAVVAALAVVLAYRTARERLGVLPALLTALAFLQFLFTYRAVLSGLEFALHALLLVALVRLDGRAGARGTRQALGLGLLAALLFLTRLDTLPFGVLVCLAALLRPGGLRAAGWIAAPLGTAFCAYWAAGTSLFGDPWPVSAYLKREWSAGLLAADPVFLRHGRLAAELHDALWPTLHQRRAFWAYLAVGLLAPLVMLLVPAGRRWLRPFATLAAFAWLQFTGAVWLYHGSYAFQPWYYLAAPWLACLLAGHAAERLVARWPRAAGGVAACTAAALLALTVVSNERWRAATCAQVEPLHMAARWVREHVRADERVGAWNAGGIAFLSGRQVVGLDGLVNSWEYARHARHDLCAYWRRTDVRYVVDAFDTRDRFGFVRQPLPCLADSTPAWVGPSFPRDPSWRVEAYTLER